MTLAIASTMGMAGNDAHAQSFSSSQMQQTKVRDLSFKSIMRALYAGKMLGNAHIADDELSQFPNVALGETSEIGKSVVALMHPVIEYENQDGQKRYLVAIEKPSFRAASRSIMSTLAKSCYLTQSPKNTNNHEKILPYSPRSE